MEGINMPKEKEWEPNEKGWESTEFIRYWILMKSIGTAPNYKTIKELHGDLMDAELGVDKRTVQRIVNYFSRQFEMQYRQKCDEPGQPIEWAWSKAEGPPVIGNIDPPTALTYEIAAQLLAPLLPPAFLGGMEPAFRNARKVLGQVNKNATSLTGKIRILPRGRGRLPAQVDQTVLNELYNALFANKQVKVRYLAASSATQKPKSYVLNPLAIIFRLDAFYLVHVTEPTKPSRDPDKVYEWPIHRFKRITTLDTEVRRPPDFVLDEYLCDPGFLRNIYLKRLHNIGSEFRLKLISSASTAKYIQERPFSEDQKIIHTRDGRVRIEAIVQNTRELLTLLHDFAADVEIVGPKVLREYFQDLSKMLYKQYKD
jgi:predicted DNA-binding transcriptional regulator YafY